jgi:hypothetical protein
MGTRAQVVFKQGSRRLWFYRSEDGYPKVVIKSLQKLVGIIDKHKIRYIDRAAGWLVVIGRDELLNSDQQILAVNPDWVPVDNGRVGTYEPCSTGLSKDISYLYWVDMDECLIYCDDFEGPRKLLFEWENPNNETARRHLATT